MGTTYVCDTRGCERLAVAYWHDAGPFGAGTAWGCQRHAPADAERVAAWVDYVATRPATYVVRCAEHGDQEARTQWGAGRLTIFQGERARADAERYAETHNAIQHA